MDKFKILPNEKDIYFELIDDAQEQHKVRDKFSYLSDNLSELPTGKTQSQLPLELLLWISVSEFLAPVTKLSEFYPSNFTHAVEQADPS